MEPMAILYHTCAVGCVMLLCFAAFRESLRLWKRETKWTSMAELYEWSARLMEIRNLLILNMGCFAVFVLCSCLLQIRVNEEVYSTGISIQYLLGILWCA